jgi:hypothetical protein
VMPLQNIRARVVISEPFNLILPLFSNRPS